MLEHRRVSSWSKGVCLGFINKPDLPAAAVISRCSFYEYRLFVRMGARGLSYSVYSGQFTVAIAMVTIVNVSEQRG
jgi:hypothetical protein